MMSRTFGWPAATAVTASARKAQSPAMNRNPARFSRPARRINTFFAFIRARLSLGCFVWEAGR